MTTFESVNKEPPEEHILKWMPFFPSAHTYASTENRPSRALSDKEEFMNRAKSRQEEQDALMALSTGLAKAESTVRSRQKKEREGPIKPSLSLSSLLRVCVCVCVFICAHYMYG